MRKRLTAADLRGILPAIPTPTVGEGVVDEQAVGALIGYLLNGGIEGVVVLGGTGEYCSLSQEQRVQMVAASAQATDGRIPTIAGVLETGFYDAQSSGKAFSSVGADALMLVTPYYTVPSQRGIRDYFLRYADASPVPVLIYEIPYRTGVAIDPEVIHELSKHENIIGLKACNTDMYHFLKVVAGVSSSFSVLGGEDTLFPLHMVAGARGGIIVTANMLPRTWKAIYRAAVEGRYEEAFTLHRKLLRVIDLSFAETNPGPLKAVWDLIGVNAPGVLPPLVPADDHLCRKLRAEVTARLSEEVTIA